MNLPARQSQNVIDARQAQLSPATEEARVLQIVRETGTATQYAQVVTYAAVRSHKVEIGLFVAFVVFFVWAMRDLCRFSRMLRRRLAGATRRRCVKCGSSPADENPRSASYGASMLYPFAFGVEGEFICRGCLDKHQSTIAQGGVA